MPSIYLRGSDKKQQRRVAKRKEIHVAAAIDNVCA